MLNVLETVQGQGRSVGPGHHDVAHSIPGMTGIFFDDLISDVAVDPYGRFVVGVGSSAGRIGIFQSDVSALPQASLDLGVGPLFNMETWPRNAGVLTGLEQPVAWERAKERSGLEAGLECIGPSP